MGFGQVTEGDAAVESHVDQGTFETPLVAQPVPAGIDRVAVGRPASCATADSAAARASATAGAGKGGRGFLFLGSGQAWLTSTGPLREHWPDDGTFVDRERFTGRGPRYGEGPVQGLRRGRRCFEALPPGRARNDSSTAGEGCRLREPPSPWLLAAAQPISRGSLSLHHLRRRFHGHVRPGDGLSQLLLGINRYDSLSINDSFPNHPDNPF